MVRLSASADPNSHSPSPTQELQQASEAVKNTAGEPLYTGLVLQ